MDCTSAYFFGLGNGTNFIVDQKEKGLLRSFELGTSGLFWLAEAPRITTWMSRIGIRLVPDVIFQSYQVMEDLCSKMSMDAKSTVSETPTKRNSHASSSHTSRSHPTVYGQLRLKLEEANTEPQTLDGIIAAEILDHLQAGHKASGITLTYLTCELSRNPEIRTMLRNELETLQTLDLSAAQLIDDLPVLDAVLMETMRLYPGIIGPFPRVVPSKGARLGDFAHIPAGTTVSASVYSLHRNPSVFREPEEWRPERWIEASEEAKKEMYRWFWVFGSGGRMCISNHLAIRSKSL